LASHLGYRMLQWIQSQEKILINITGAQVDIKKHVKKALVHLTIKHAAENLAVEFGANGFTVMAAGSADEPTAGKQTAGAAAMAIKIDAANREGQNYLTKAGLYLQQIGMGTYGETLQASIDAAYKASPLFVDLTDEPISRGNDKRKIFVF
jgi:hypothetical protein